MLPRNLIAPYELTLIPLSNEDIKIFIIMYNLPLSSRALDLRTILHQTLGYSIIQIEDSLQSLQRHHLITYRDRTTKRGTITKYKIDDTYQEIYQKKKLEILEKILEKD